ncbi:ABC transporter permease [Tenacibaculum sp. nBUS_03]|uniref:ABC transporter permease n=1 Tax=Tenacibaculum sp. nBUS_03 TaxID=3395320 RepID=UPI003EBD5FEB
MLKLNFLLVLREIKKDKKSFLINILGASVGLTTIILMSLYVFYEKNYDSFNENNDRLYRVERVVNDKVQNQIFDSTPFELSKEIKSSFPEIEHSVSAKYTSNFLAIGDKLYPRQEGILANNDFLKMFSFQFVSGNRFKALERPMSIVISESLGKKLFPNGDVLGKTIKINKKHILNVTGVFKDYPKNSHFKMEYIISFNSLKELYDSEMEKGWGESYVSTYILLDKNANVDRLSNKIKNLLAKHNDFKDGITQTLNLRPVEDIYLKTLGVRNDSMGGRRNTMIIINLFIIIVFFTAFITIVNYINMTTTKLINRELEIGMKKVLGISKRQLQAQFILESLVKVISVIIVSSVLVIILLPVFNSVVSRELSFVFRGSWLFILKILFFSVFFGIVAGLYPVFYLSSLKITSFLQGNTSIKRRRGLRKGLVFFQLFVTIPLIVLSYYIVSQINYLKEKDLGFNKKNVLTTWVKISDSKDLNRVEVVKNTLLENPNVLNYSISECAPFLGFGDEKKVNWEGNKTDDKASLTTYGVDYDFIDVFKMKMKEGRWFSKEYSTDKQSSCVINETAVSLLGWDNPIGKTLDNGKIKVIGVVKDFDQVSLTLKIPPLMLNMNSDDKKYFVIGIKVNDNNKAETRGLINKTFNSHFPEKPIEFGFLEDGMDAGYMSALENVMRMFMLASIISILLVIVGLYTLISFSLKMQKRMIAMHKILGATKRELFKLILKEYVILYALAATLGLILTYFLILQFSQIGAYSVSINPVAFIIVVLTTFLIVLFTISGKIWSASSENPIKAITLE